MLVAICVLFAAVAALVGAVLVLASKLEGLRFEVREMVQALMAADGENPRSVQELHRRLYMLGHLGQAMSDKRDVSAHWPRKVATHLANVADEVRPPRL